MGWLQSSERKRRVGQQILLDSTVVIAALSDTDSHYVNAQEIFSETSRTQIAVSAVSVGEILIRPSAAGEESVELFLSRLDKLIHRIIPFEKDHARLAALIRAKQKTTFVDSMIISTAILENRTLISFDRKMMGIYERVK